MQRRPKKLLDQVREAIRHKHYIRFHDKRHPKEMGADEIWAYLSHLAVEKRVAASTQNEAS